MDLADLTYGLILVAATLGVAVGLMWTVMCM